MESVRAQTSSALSTVKEAMNAAVNKAVKSTVLVRPATPEDRAAIYDVLMTSGVFGRVDADCVDEMFVGTWAALNANPEADTYRWLVAEQVTEQADDATEGVSNIPSASIIGFACYGTESLTHGTWDLYWVCVRPSARGKGAGRMLLQTSVAGARALGARMMVIYTSSTPPYTAARATYEASGFSRAAVVPDYYDDGDDLHIYAQRLSGVAAGN